MTEAGTSSMRIERQGQRLVCITNIPSPYRLHLFEHLNRELSARGIAMEVLFMAETERGRYWPFQSQDWSFPHRVVWGIHPYIRNCEFHFNPQILFDVLRQPPTWLLIGGGWHLPTAFLLAFLQPLYRHRSTVLLWAEANERSSRYLSGPIAAFRRSVARQVDGFVVPGKIAEDAIRCVYQWPDSPLILLPNIVDESIYGTAVDRARRRRALLRDKYSVKQGAIALLCPARLHEASKGILNFLQALEPMRSDHICILMAGEGPDRPKITAWLQKTGFSQAQLLGHQDQSAMVELLALSDILVLPSFREPFGFVVIEGLWAGLPLLVSKNVGSWPEALKAGKNGWLFDPYRPEQIRAAVGEALALGPEGLAEYGHSSRRIAQERFSTPMVVRRFVDALVEHSPNRVHPEGS